MTDATGPATGDTPAIDLKAQARSRRMLLLILACFAVPLILAMIWLRLVQSSNGDLGSTARGELVDPAVPLEPFSQATLTGDEVALDDVRGLWTLLYVPTGECGETCRLNLYHMRQVRLALNHRMDRVQRMVVVETPNQLDASLLAEHAGLQVLQGSDEPAGLVGQIDAAIAEMEPVAQSIYVIDPLGNLMMRFAPDLPPKSMLKDLKHLLKVSRIG